MFRLVLFVLLGLATFKLALADPDVEYERKVTQLPIFVNCVQNEVFFKMVDEYGEKPFSEGNGTWSIPYQDMSGRIITYVNPSTLTYTIAIDLIEVKCVVISGNNFSPLLSDKNST